MTVGVTVDIRGGTAHEYEQVIGKLFPDGKLPKGWLVHIAGPTDSGWRVVNVVASQEEFDSLLREQLLPAMQGVGDPPPQVTFFPIYKLIRS